MSFQDHLPKSEEELDAISKLFSYREKPIKKEIIDSIKPYRYRKPNHIPFVTVKDLNNRIDDDPADYARPKRAIEIGISGTF